jgi:mannitol/fructose-specific phosphotransferase system IIA component (Ntr-type)
MRLADLITEKHLLPELKGETRRDVYLEMVDHLVEQKILPVDLRDKVISALEQREAKMTTAIGDGLGLPHAAVTGLPGVIALLAKSSKGLDCKALDGKPVYLFLLILVPNEDYGTHLRTLALATRFLNQSTTRERLKAASSAKELLAVVAGTE